VGPTAQTEASSFKNACFFRRRVEMGEKSTQKKLSFCVVLGEEEQLIEL
jgi:hypothetical protein